MRTVSLLAAAICAPTGRSFYLPGVAPHNFRRGEKVDLKVNKLTSSRTQIPYEYYSLPFCTPDEGVMMSAENLGEFLTGDRIDNSPYQLLMRDDTTCNVLCQKTFSAGDAEAFKNAIEEEYHHNWIVDNLPAAGISKAGESGALKTQYVKGFPVGYIAHDENVLGYAPGAETRKPRHYIYNHMELIVQYHQVKEGFEGADSNRVVGFLVQPRSVKHMFANGETWSGHKDDFMPYLTTCEKYADDPLEAAAEWNEMDKEEAEQEAEGTSYYEGYYYWDDWGDWDGSSSGSTVGSDKQGDLVEPQAVEPGHVLFTYDVTWKPSKVHWASRWDIYLSMDGAVSNKVHWFSIFNSLIIVVLLSGLVGMILTRSVYGDISRYNQVRQDDVTPLTDEERQIEKEESGWKLVHGNVFTPPKYPLLFCVFVGTGLQLLHMSVATAAFAALGFLSPANRGSMMLGAIFLYCVFAAGGGYNAARWHRAFSGENWKLPGMLVAFGFPGLCFVLFLISNLCLSNLQSSGAVPLLTMFGIVFVWFGVSSPLAVTGSYLGHMREPALEFPLKGDRIPRPIPEQPWFLSDGFAIIVGGILPFGACFVELFFILNSIWMDQYYYVFGFTLIVALILCVTCAEITMVLVYFQLCSEDYHWWWRSFLASGSTAIYMFLYSILYFSKLEANLAITYFLYFGYMALACLGVFLITGTVGFAAAFWFVRAIYSSIKID